MRSAGIIMPISSLPSAYGIGTLGAQARSFVDFLHDAGQTVWQVLPVGPTGFGDSPYQSCSSYAGNPYFIDFEDLTSWGYLTPDAYRGVNWGGDSGRVDYGMLYRERFAVLACAVSRLEASEPERLERFCEQQAFWLDDYSLYMALKKHFGGLPWHKWPDEYRLHKAEALERARRELDEDVRLWKGIQFFFFAQWSRLHEYARERGERWPGALPTDSPPQASCGETRSLTGRAWRRTGILGGFAASTFSSGSTICYASTIFAASTPTTRFRRTPPTRAGGAGAKAPA